MQYNIAQYKGATFSSVAKGFGAFLAGNFAQNSSTDILYILEDGTALADAAAEAAYLYPDLQILKFPAWDTDCRAADCLSGGACVQSDA